MKLLVHRHVVTELFSYIFIHCFLKVSCLSCIEHLAEYVLPIIRSFPLEAHRLSEPTRDHFTKQLIFDPIVEENGATFDIKQVGEHLHETGQVKFQRIVEGYVSSDVEQSQSVLNGLARLQEKVIFSLPGAKHLSHGRNHAFSHQMRVKDAQK